MKRCPRCAMIFQDDSDFCPNDGSVLGFLGTDSSETVMLSRPAGADRQAPSKNAWLIGAVVLLLAVVAVMGFMLFQGAKPAPAAANVAAVTPSSTPAEDRAAQSVPEPRPAEARSPVPTPASDSPAGTWNGSWSSKTADYSARTSLVESGGRVTGKIQWTLDGTTNPKRASKVGQSATEFIEGSFDPASRSLRMRGVRKDDPSGIIILDRYSLTLSADGRELSGKSINGRFVLTR